MSEDARFEDGREAPLRLRAEDGEDLKVLAALVQDAVFPIGEIAWDRRRRRFALLLNRFRWEDKSARHAAERVQSVLAIDGVINVASQGVDRRPRRGCLALRRSPALDPRMDPGARPRRY